jgi:hypothetical protein
MESFIIGKLDRGLKFVYRELEQFDDPEAGQSFFNWGTILVENVSDKDLIDFVTSTDDDCRIIENLNANTFILSKKIERPLIINKGSKPHVFANEEEQEDNLYHFQFTEHHKVLINFFVDLIYQKLIETNKDIKVYLIANLVPLKLIFVSPTYFSSDTKSDS